MVGAEELVALDGPLIGRGHLGAAGDEVVLAHVAGGTGCEAAVGGNGRTEASDGRGGGGEAIGGDLVRGVRVADVARAGGIGAGGGRIVDRDLAVGLVDPVSEVAAVHFGGGNGEDDIVGAYPIAEAFVGDKEKGFVATVVELRDANGSGKSTAEVVLAVDGAAGGEEAARVHGVVAKEVIDGAVNVVGAGLGGEAHDAAASLAVLGLEAVRIDRKFGESFDGGGIQGGFFGVAGTVGPDAMPVEGGIPGRGLATAEREALSASARFSGHRDQIKRAAHRATNDKGKFVDQLVLDLCRYFRVIRLDGSGGGGNFDLFGHLAELQLQFQADGRRSGDDDVLLDVPFEAGGGDGDAIDAGEEVGGGELTGW